MAVIILDFETNSTNVHDVIEAAAFRIRRREGRYEVVETFHRYYYSRYPVNPHALAVHRLSPERVERLRDGAGYEAYFEDDQEFVDFCRGATTLVAHNAAFELRHLGNLVRFSRHLCTMQPGHRSEFRKSHADINI